MTIRDIVVAFGFQVDRNSERQAESSIKGIKSMASKLLGAIGIVFSIKGMADLAQTAADAEALKSQFSQVFGDMEKEAADKLQAISDDTGVMVNRMKGSFTQIAAFSKTTGLAQAEALEIANRAMIAVNDSAAFYDRSIEDVTESMRSFLKGNFEQDAALGLSCTETTRNAAANALYSKSFKDLSEAEKQFTLLQMVEDANKASGALGQAARESDTWTNQLGNLKQSLTDLKAAAGSTFLKPAVAVLKLLTSLVQRATKAFEGLTAENGMLTRATEGYHALVKRLQPAIDRMTQTLSKGMERGKEVVKGVVDRLGGAENVLKILAIVAGAFLAAMAWKKVIDGAKKYMKLLNGMASMFGVGKAKILAVAAVIIILALIIEDFINFLLGNDSVIGTIFDNMGIGAENARQAVFDAFNKIKEFLLGVWEFLKMAAFMFIGTVKEFLGRHLDSIRADFERVWGIVKTFLNGVWTFLTQLAATLFGNTEEEIDDSAQSTKDNLLSVWQSILNALSAIFDILYEVVSSVLNAVATVIETVFGWIQTFWSNWGSEILAWFKTVWDSMGSILHSFLDIIKGIADFITSVFTGDWAGAWEAIKQVFIGVWDSITAVLSTVWETVKLLFSMGLSAVQSIWNTVWGAVKSFFSSTFESIAALVSSILLKIKDSVTSRIKGVKDAIINGINEAVNFIKALPSQAVQWGADFINGLKNGIMAGIQGIKNAVKGVADSIRSMLHFSVPDEGPLTDYESWMPDFMGGLAKGITDNKGIVLGRIKELAGGIQVLMSAATANASARTAGITNNRTSNVTQNVSIANSYSGGSMETQKNVAKAMRKSAVDATTQMARSLAYARG